MRLHFTAVRLNVPAAVAIKTLITTLMVGGSSVAADVCGTTRVCIEGVRTTDPDAGSLKSTPSYTAPSPDPRRPEMDEVSEWFKPRVHTYETNEPKMRYTDEFGNKGTLWCNPGPCTAGSPLKHGWATGVGTFLPLKLVEDVKKTLGEAVNKEIATFSSATNRKIFNITLDALLASAETSDDPKLKSAASMTTAQIKSNHRAFEKSQEDKGGSSIVVETPVEETPVVEAPVVEAPVEEAPVVEAPVDEGTEAPVEEWDDDCAGTDQCNIPIEGVDF